jgi:hypothetical protein
MISLACSSPFQPAATETPVPSATLAPTATDTPEPTPTFTATPNRAATQAAESTAMAEEVIAQFQSEMSEYEISTDTGYLGWVQDAPITVTLNGVNDLEYQAMANGLEAGDFILRTNITWNTQSLIYCGLVFRADSRFEEGEHYEFWFLRFSGLPVWEIQFWDGMDFIATASNGEHSSSALDQANGATNQIIIVAEDFAFTVFINGVRQGKYFDFNSLRSNGQFGLAGFHDTGNSTCRYEDTVIWVYR